MTLKILTILFLMFGLCASGTVVLELFTRLSCRSYYQYFVSNLCYMSGTNSFMKLQISIFQEFSDGRCVKGSTYGLAKDNSHIWVSGLCHAEFSIFLVTYHPNTLEPTTEESTTEDSTIESSTITSAAPTTTTAAAAPATTTNKPQSVNGICGQANSAFRIIGGTKATRCEYPWMVLLEYKYKDDGSMCGGFIIDSTHILTAAHCVVYIDNTTNSKFVVDASKLYVYTGSSTVPGSDFKRRFVAKVTPHEHYNVTKFRNILLRLSNDIAILTLTEPISFNTCQRPLCLVSATSSPLDAINCRVMGWGVTSNENNASVQTNLQWVDAPVVDDIECMSRFSIYNAATNLCVGQLGKSPCKGDSGGPLACRESDGRYYAHGIVSFGPKDQCGWDVSVFTKVSSFVPWIQRILSITG